MLAARMVQTFDFSNTHLTERLSFRDDDFQLLRPVEAETIEIIDLDGKLKPILYPGNESDHGM